MPAPRNITKEFFIPDENPYFEEDEDEHLINESRSQSWENQIDNLLHLFDLLEESISRTRNRNPNHQENAERNIENHTLENKENDEIEIQNNYDQSHSIHSNNNNPHVSAHQTILDLDELEGLLTELYLLSSGRRNQTNENVQQALQSVN